MAVTEGVIFALDSVGDDREGQGFAEIAVIDLGADDFHVGKDLGRGFAWADFAGVVIPTVVEFPVCIVDIEFEAILGGEGLGIDAVDDLDAEVKWVLAIVLDGDFFGHDVAGDDVDALDGEFAPLVGGFVDDKLEVAGGDDVGGLADGGVEGQGALAQEGDGHGDERHNGEFQFRFMQHKSPLR